MGLVVVDTVFSDVVILDNEFVVLVVVEPAISDVEISNDVVVA